VDDKLGVFRKMLEKKHLKPEETGFMGDELVDLPVLERCGFACAPREAPQQVRQCAHYVCSAPAGGGAVRELCEYIMQAQGTFERQLREYLA
jgi:3-deoxy-D-manno-octulosonate 8-phosphate phosphatase (KDO 8-P phosphatase)